MIDRVGLVPSLMAHNLQGHILLFQADEVNSGGGFEPVPKAEINNGFIPDIKHLPSHRRTLSQEFLGLAFKGMDILFFLAAGGGQSAEGASAQIEDIEMPGGISLNSDDYYSPAP